MRNQVQLIGNLGIDPEITNYENGRKRVRFTMAINEKFTDKEGQSQERTFWHNLHAWGPTASYIAKSAKKGAQVAILGKLVNYQYQSKEGKDRQYSSIEVQNAITLS